MAHRIETKALHAATEADETKSRQLPVYRNAAYLFDDAEHAANLFALKELGNIYTRLMNPTHDRLERRVAALEGAPAALALASGTSAIFYTVINVCGKGDEVVASSNLYGGTFTMFDAILPELGVNVVFVDPTPEAFDAATTDKTRLFYTESIGNPSLDVMNVRALAEVAKKRRVPLAVDSTFTTPYLFRPIEHGADIVVHSLTKWMGGHGAGVGGIVVDGGTFDWTDEKFRLYNEPDKSYHGLRYARDLGDLNPVAFALRMRLVPLRNLGAAISPDNAWQFLQGIETLHLRMQRHSENALRVAEFLQSHEAAEWTRYPGLPGDPAHENAKSQFENGFGGMAVFGVKGGRKAGEKFVGATKLFSHVANVGDAKSLVIHPASTTHSQLSEEQLRAGGVSPDMVRLSIGIEHVDDILEDVDQALKAARG